MRSTWLPRWGRVAPLLLTATLAAGAPAVADPGDPLTLGDAVERALAASPTLASHDARVEAARGRARQAGALTNPELSVEAEDFGRSGGDGGTDDVQTTVTVAQPIDLFGRRRRRRDAGDAMHRAAVARAEAARRRLVADVTAAFDAVLFADARLALADETLRLTRNAAAEAASRARQGTANVAEETLAATEAARAEVLRERALVDTITTRAALASFWGGDPVAMVTVVGSLDPPADAPPLPALVSLAEDAPEITALAADTDAARSSETLARLERLPDVTVHVGGRHFHRDGANALVAGLTVPVPIFDRNAGAITAAAADVGTAAARVRAQRTRAATALTTLHATLTAAVRETQLVDRLGLPAATRALNATRAAHDAGAPGHLDVLAAIRELTDWRARRLDASERACAAAIEIDRLAGTSLRTPQVSETGDSK